MITLLLAVAQQLERSIEHDLYRTQMAAAESAIRLGELAIARAWLDETDPTMRGFEWRVHDALLDESLQCSPTGEMFVYALDASADGATLAWGYSNGAVELRSAVDHALIASLGAHKESVTYARFDRSGTKLVTSSFDRTVKVWDVPGRKLAFDFTRHGFPIGAATFSPDGGLVASCSYERLPELVVVGTVHLWSATDGQLVRTLEGGRKPLIGIQFSPDGRKLAAGSWDFCVFVWSVDGGAPIECAVPDEGIYNAVDDVTWSGDGKFVIGASKDKTARVWNAESGALVTTLRGHTDYVAKLAMAPDGALLATASADGSVRLWRTADWSLRATLNGHADDVTSVSFSPDGARLYSSSNDRTVRSWDVHSPWYGGAKFATNAAPYVVRYSPDEREIAVASYDGRVEIRDAATLESKRSWQAHPEGKSCHGLVWTPDGTRLVTGSWEPALRVWDARTGAESATLQQTEGSSSVAISPDGKLVASASGKKAVVWNLELGSKVLEFAEHTSTVLAVHFSPDSSLCVSTGRDGFARVWDAASGTARFSIPASSQDVAEARFTPDGAQIVVATRAGHVTLHSARDGQLVRSLARLRHGTDHFEISPDASRVAVASNVIALIDLTRDGVVGELRPHVEHPYNVAFDTAGTRLISCSTDKTVAVSQTRPLRSRTALKTR